jgi:Tol biopolymer transport system component
VIASIVGLVVGLSVVAAVGGVAVSRFRDSTPRFSFAGERQTANGIVAYVSGDFSGERMYSLSPGENPPGTELAKFADFQGLAWAPDGSRLAFSAADESGYHIYVMNADGTAETRLTQGQVIDEAPTWSPDGTQIAFQSNRNDPNVGKVGYAPVDDIYVMAADGSKLRSLTSGSSNDVSPTWSPDGSTIAFSSDAASGRFQIFSLDLASGAQKQLTDAEADNYDPVWSPDGSQIVFVSTRTGNADVWTMSSDGSTQVDLTNNPSEDTSPLWAPNGSLIMFATDRNAASPGSGTVNSDIYTMKPDGDGQAPVITSDGWDGEAAWQPQIAAGAS